MEVHEFLLLRIELSKLYGELDGQVDYFHKICIII